MLFEDAEMTINWGERVALVGPNGAGKSTLFKIILKEEEADNGTVDRDEYGMVGYLAQEAGDPGEATILEIAMGINEEFRSILETLRTASHDSEEYGVAQDRFEELNGFQLEPKAKKILAGLGYSQEDFQRPANMFSGGWIMRAHLARLLVEEPDLLMLDEPTNHLDLNSLMWFQRYLNQYPGALLIISHDRSFMDGVVEKVYEIDEQKFIAYEGNYSKYLTLKDERYDQQMKAFQNQKKEIARIQEFIDKFRSVGSKASQVQSRIKMIEKMDKLPKPRKPRKLFHFHFPQPPRSTQRVISLENVDKAYGDKVIYKNLDVQIERGDRVVLVGPNGAGKSTLIKSIMGVVPTAGGWTKVFDKPIKENLHRVGYVPQRESVDWDFPVTVMDVALMGTYGKLGLFRRAGKKEKLIASEALDKVGMLPYAKRQIGNLSGGQQQRVFLARALAQDSDLYFMDEPFTGVDAATESAIITLLKEMREKGKTVLVVHHDLQTARDYFDHLLLLNMRLVAFGKTEDMYTTELLQKTYGGRLTILDEVAGQSANLPEASHKQ